jgi:hypothetical protein
VSTGQKKQQKNNRKTTATTGMLLFVFFALWAFPGIQVGKNKNKSVHRPLLPFKPYQREVAASLDPASAIMASPAATPL